MDFPAILCLIQFPANGLGKAVEWFGTLPLTWETQMKRQNPAFGKAQRWLLGASGEWTRRQSSQKNKHEWSTQSKEKCSASLAIREMQITPVRMAKIHDRVTDANEDPEKEE